MFQTNQLNIGHSESFWDIPRILLCNEAQIKGHTSHHPQVMATPSEEKEVLLAGWYKCNTLHVLQEKSINHDKFIQTCI